MGKLYRCYSCDFETDDGDAVQPWQDAESCMARLNPGDVVPYGICDCNGFVYRCDETLLAWDAAKDLLSACKACLHQIGTDSDLDELVTRPDKYDELEACLRAAIAKAEGNSDVRS